MVKKASLVGKEFMAAFNWRASIGGWTLTDREVADLAAAMQPLVQIRGQWMEVDPVQIASAAAFLAKEGSGKMSAQKLVRHAITGQVETAGLPVVNVVADGELGKLLTGNHDLKPIPLSTRFLGDLRPYQKRGFYWLSFLSQLGLGAVLADDMGLGKGVQALALVASEGPTSGPTLVISPMSLVGNWQREAAKFAPTLRIYVHHGSGRRSGERLRHAIDNADLVITTYGIVQRDEVLRAIDWHRVIADEAQNIKNRSALQSRAVRRLRAQQRLALTGTPVENRLSELHAILDFVNPGLFGSEAHFKEIYSVPIERDSSVRATETLRKRTSLLILRRLKVDPTVINDLPEKQEMTVLCNLTEEQVGLYSAVVSDMLTGAKRAKGLERRGLVLAGLSKLKQICNHPSHFLKERDRGPRFGERSGKLARLEDILEESLASGDRTLCFTQFAEFGYLLSGYLEARFHSEVPFLHGSVSRAARDSMVRNFQRPDGPAIFVLSLKAGGTGLNLTAANQVIHVDRWWNPAVEEQATDRAFRIGQQRNVQVRKFVCMGTVEERIDAVIDAKRTLAEMVIGSGESWLAGLPLDGLRELVELSEDALST